jgi:AcrR family transcriptional regulator
LDPGRRILQKYDILTKIVITSFFKLLTLFVILSTLPMNQLTAKAAAKRQRVIEAACLVFRRHGFARTSLDAIAETAGISRPSLYLVFPNKEAVFAAAVHHMGALALAQLRENLPANGPLEEQLLFVCTEWAGRGYDRMKENPDAKDLIDPSLPPVRDVYDKLQAFLAELLNDAVAQSNVTATPAQLAELLVSALRGIKEMAHDVVEVRRMIALQVHLLVRSLNTETRRASTGEARSRSRKTTQR